MKNVKKLLFVALVLLLLPGCSVLSNSETDNESTESEKISLNITHADLIADITDNEKYLNKDLLYKVDTLDDDDKISIIVTLDSKGLSDYFTDDDKGYSSLSDYASSRYALNKVGRMLTSQNELAQKLINEGYINEVNHNYTTLLNGFSAQTTYGQFRKLELADLDVQVTISEVYSKPDYQLTSTKDSYDAVTNFVNVYETGIFNSSEAGYDGSNTAVAILDSGFDIHHTVFQNMPNEDTLMLTREDIEEILYESKAYGYHQNIKTQDVYMNDKIPFAFDYADKDPDVAPYDSDHGTHVAGIIGGKDDAITGVAINTQLVLMKVFGDINNGAIQEDILAALEDAMLIGVDAINLSLGTACGFSRSSDNEYINTVYDKIESSGVSLVVAASNDYSSGYGGEFSNTNKASNPDSATVGSPGTYSSTLSVASISGVKSKYMIDEDGYTFFFNNANNSAGEAYDFYDMLFDLTGTNKSKLEIEYVTVPGVGKKVNYSNIDVKGKIALVKRGETSFEEKAAVAKSQGAIGCIIYNNVAGDVFMNAGNKLEIAFCSVSKDDGEVLAKKESGILVLDKSYLAGPFMSEFSSWGPVSDLSLKPEITAHGGSILSSVPGGGYDEISGTSMACPNLCGVVILLRQALKERYPDKAPLEITNMANQILMSTGTIVLDEHANPYSPRKQGAGLGNLDYALKTLAYLSVDGSTKAKIELGDDPEEKGIYELEFEINNVSNKELKYNLTNYTMTESLSVADPRYVAEKAYMLNPKTSASVTGDGSISDEVITVNPNGKVTVKYTLELTNEEKKYIRKSFINGIYVEGFAVLESLNEDKIDLSIPFLAFFGDWTVAPMFDKTFYEVESEKYDGAIDYEDKINADYYASTPLGTYYYSYIIPLGSYVYEIDEEKYDKIPAKEEHASIGYNIDTINGITTVYAGLLRNAKKMTTTIRNSDTGDLVYEHVKYDEHKAYFSGSIIPGYDLINITAADMGLQNNTKYTFKMEAELDYGNGGIGTNLNNTFEFSFYVDYETPLLTNAEFYSKYDKSLKDYRYYVDAYVYDNHYAQSIRPFTIVEGKLVSLSEYPIPIYGEKGDITKVTIEITDYMDLLQYGKLEDSEFPMTNGLGFLIDDYALNQSYSYVSLPGTNSTEIGYKEDVYSSFTPGANEYDGGTYQYRKDIRVGDELDLTEMLTTTDPNVSDDPEVQKNYFSTLKWTSSNENVIKINKGKLEAIGTGQATISCFSMLQNGYLYEVKLKLKVRDKITQTSTTNKLTDINFTYFETLKAFIDGPEISEIGEVGDRFFFTEKSSISFYPSEQVKLSYELEPWNLKDYTLHWSSTNDKVATVDENGVVTAVKEGSATITLKVEVGGRMSSLVASVRVQVKNEFVIEGNTLVAYKGNGGDVVIPDDEGILYVGPFAFSLYTTDYEIKIEEDDYDAAKTPASNNTVTSVTIPAEVLEVQKYAFYNCTALENVTFLVNEENKSCPLIREYAFAKNSSLKNINLENILVIGSRAFSDCKLLNNIDISRVYALGSRAFENCEALSYADITAVRNAGKEVFLNCSNLTTIDNGEFTNFSEGMFKNSGLTTIEFKADRIPNKCFENCHNLKNATIVNDLVYVGSYAFTGCENLESFKFNDGVTSEFIYTYAFNNCSKLEEVVLPDSEVIVENNVFNNCTNLSNVLFNKNTFITNNLGEVFAGCTDLAAFTVDDENSNYKTNGSLLLSADGKTIILAAPNYEYNEYTIPAGIETVGESAFSSIEKLSKLIIPSDVKLIASNAFSDCENLTEIVVNSSNLEILDKAFMNCIKLNTITNIDLIKVFAPYVFSKTALTSLVLNNVTIEVGAFSNINSLVSVSLSGVETIGDGSFLGCGELTTLITDALLIGKNAFADCVKLENPTLSNVVEVKEGAFKGCKSITEIKYPTLKIIGDYAFCDLPKLEKLELTIIESIGEGAFSTTNKEQTNLLKEIIFPNTLKEIGSRAFESSKSLISVDLGSGIEEIGSFAFSNCTSLEEVTANCNVPTIREGIFSDCEKLKDVNINGIEYIEDGAFYNCLSLENINLASVIEIGMNSFCNCLALTKADMPNVTKLGVGAFVQSSNLVTVNMPKIETIAEQALSCIGVTEIKLPETVTYIAPTAFYYNVNQVKFSDMAGNVNCQINDYIRLDDGVLYTVTSNNKYLLSSYPTAKETATYEVIFNTVRIEEYAGYFNPNLEKVIFPATLTMIGNMAFFGCTKLDTVHFKSTVAPTLEGTIIDYSYEYEEESEIYELLNKYFQFNGYYPLFYGQFKNMIGLTNKMSIVIPGNSDVVGYDESNILYNLYFDLENKTISENIELSALAIDYIDKASMVPTNVVLTDEKVIVDARTAYNTLEDEHFEQLNKHYEKAYLDSLYDRLVKAEEAWLKLKMSRINKVYDYLIEAIEKLGPNYSFDKLADYYEISKVIDRLDRSDEKYIDDSNVESFKDQFDKYFKDLNEDVNTMTEVTTLPTSTVNKVGLIAVTASFSLILGIALIIKKYWFI